MDRRSMLQTTGAAALLPLALGHELLAQTTADTVYELRTYYAVAGKLDLLLERFRSKTQKIFNRLDLPVVAYWTPTDPPLAGTQLIYIVRHKSREAATANWAKFQADPEWIAVKTATEKDGPLTTKIDAVFMKLTDFSAKA